MHTPATLRRTVGRQSLLHASGSVRAAKNPSQTAWITRSCSLGEPPQSAGFARESEWGHPRGSWYSTQLEAAHVSTRRARAVCTQDRVLDYYRNHGMDRSLHQCVNAWCVSRSDTDRLLERSCVLHGLHIAMNNAAVLPIAMN